MDYMLNPAPAGKDKDGKDIDGDNFKRIQAQFAYHVDDNSKIFIRSDMKDMLCSIGGSYKHDDWHWSGEVET